MVFSPLKNIFNILTSNKSLDQESRKRKCDAVTDNLEESSDIALSRKRIKVNPIIPETQAAGRSSCRQCEAGLPGHISHIMS